MSSPKLQPAEPLPPLGPPLALPLVPRWLALVVVGTLALVVGADRPTFFQTSVAAVG